MSSSKRGLGKRLGALLADVAPQEGEQIRRVSIDKIKPNRFQPRARFDETKLEELASSIAQHGILQPLLVRESAEGYELIAGERRWRAARMAGLKEVPVVLRSMDDARMHEIALIENLQREDLNPIEEALAYRALMDHLKITQDELSKRLGKSRSAVANTLRLLQLDKSLQDMVRAGELSEGHARALLSLPKEDQKQVARQVAARGLTVRQTEKMAQRISRSPVRRGGGVAARDPYIQEVERRLQQALSAPVRLLHQKRKGVIEIEYFGPEDLERIVELLEQQRASG